MQPNFFVRSLAAMILFVGCYAAEGQIPKPDDAPKPLTPSQSAAAFKLPDGFRMQVVASEPLIASPTGVCWDARGRMFVSELHGYNLPGELEITELNKTGKLDQQVRRVHAAERFQKAAKSGTFGVVKMLRDTDGDGRMDKVDVWAKDLPPAYGLVPARDGVIVACAPHVVYLADHDGDGKAEVREILFTGFHTGELERGINAPRWGDDGWIYFGSGRGSDAITGVRLLEPVKLPNTDFRIRPDGSAIEPVTGRTLVFGAALTRSGDRFITDTTTPAIYIAPLPWRYLVRNPDVPTPGIEVRSGDARAYSIAPPHPWRQKRADHPAYRAFYTRIGRSDSEASGWFTAACGPFVYRDRVLPGLSGQYFVCDPAANLIHRAAIHRSGSVSTVRRIVGEAKSEFAASSDPWSHPMFLSHGPDGSIWVVDYYREIIEDYSAIPRHLQQQYRLYAGHDRGRVYRLTHADAPVPTSTDMSELEPVALVRELASPIYWRRQTAQRLLVEGDHADVAVGMRALLADSNVNGDAAIAALRTLEGVGAITPGDISPMLTHSDTAVRIHALQLSDRWMRGDLHAGLLGKIIAASAEETDGRVLIQSALTLGESRDSKVVPALAAIARRHAEVRWMDSAILSGVRGRAKPMLAKLRRDPGGAAAMMKSLSEWADAAERAPNEAEAVTLPDDFKMPVVAVNDATFRKYVASLGGERDVNRGHRVFTRSCAACHRIGEEGKVFGPDLVGELGVAEQTLLRHVLVPAEQIRPGFETVAVELRRGAPLLGLLVNDGATSVTVRLPGGVDRVVLRKDVARVRIVPGSLMPSFAGAIPPAEMADLLAWLRSRLVPEGAKRSE